MNRSLDSFPTWRPRDGMSRVLIVGAGGLGCPVAISLAHHGGFAIDFLDPDRVELSNLHRQILYRETDLGRPKASVAAERLFAQFPSCEAQGMVGGFSPNRADLLEDYDAVVDATDQFTTKLQLADACWDAGVDYVFGGVVAFEGQVMGVRPGVSSCIRCLFDRGPAEGEGLSCEQQGILGPIAGIVGAKQAEVLMRMRGPDPEAALNRLWVYEDDVGGFRTVRVRSRGDCPGCGRPPFRRRGWGEEPTANGSLASGAKEARELRLEHLVCPHTFVETRKALSAMVDGDRLWVVLGSDEAARNVPVAAIAAGHRVLAQSSEGRLHRILIQKETEEIGHHGHYSAHSHPAS
jgi:molybdopterin-synthase adenylyltransferase